MGVKDIIRLSGVEPLYLKNRDSQRIESLLAGGRGVEPLFADPESVVLPLDEPPIPAGGILPCQIYSV